MLYVIVLLIVVLLGASLLRNVMHGRIDHTTVSTLDLKRYMGTWYEIARLDNRFERGMTHVTASYTLRPDGTVEVVNSGTCPKTGERRTSRGRAKTTSHPGRLRVSFFWIFYSDYKVLELADDYSWAVIGSRTSGYLWFLSRTPTVTPEVFEQMRIKAQERGYDVDQLVVVDQSGPHE